MNLNSRLTFALITVVVFVVLGHIGYSVYLDFRTTRTTAANQIERAKQRKLLLSLKESQEQTRLLADALIHNGRIQSGYDSRNKSELAQEIKTLQGRFAFPGNIQVIDEKGNLVYSTETPNQSGYSVSKENFGVQVVLSAGKFYAGVTASEKSGLVNISTIMPLKNGGKSGVIAVNQPLAEEYLTSLASRFAIEDPSLDGIELAVFSNKTHQVAAFSQGVRKMQATKFLASLNDKGEKAIPTTPLGTGIEFLDKLIVPASGFESNNAWWNYLYLNAKDPKDVVGVIFILKAVPSEQGKILETTLLGGTIGLLGIVAGFLFSTQIASSVNDPLRFLVKRTQAISNNRQVIPPLEGLSGDWLELGELIDTAVLSMRSTTQSLKKELNKQMEQGKERHAQAEQSTQQLDTLNKQITTQAQKITELGRHVSQATRQAIIVQQQLDAVLQSATEGFLVLDQYGNILHSNLVFLNWTGCQEGEIAGRLCFDLVRKPGEAPYNPHQGQAFAQHGGDPNALINQFYPEGVIYNKTSAKKVEVLTHLQPLTGDDGNIAGYIMALRDRSLRSENQLLRQEIVNMLQQDIRQPLTAAEQSWKAIMANAPTSMHPSMGQAIAQLHIHYESLIGVIDSLLMIYGGFTPPPPLPKEPIAITRLVADCLEEVTSLAKERQLLLDYKTVTGLPTISGDRESIRGILSQVLERMIMVTQPGGRVRVESQLKGQEMRIGVSSSGPALPQSEIADMFVGFIEGKHAQETYGSRLSMYLARNNVERLGGHIWAESEAGRGTTTYFTLPIGG